MKTSYVLIDFENVQVKSLALLKGDNFRVKVFLGPKNSRLPVELVLAMQELGKRAGYVVLGVSGANALDFHITYYLGKFTAEDPDTHFHIISKDTGFDSLIKHLQSNGIHCKRSPSIEQMLGAAPAVKQLHEHKVVPRLESKMPEHKTAEPKTAAPKTRAAPAKKAKPVVALDPTLQTIIENLKARGSARPRTIKTLTSCIKTLRLNLADEEIAAQIAALQSSGTIKVSGVQVTYKL